MSSFKERLKRELERAKIYSQEEAARKLGVDKSMISRYLSGEVDQPHKKTIAKFAEALGIPLESLFSDKVQEYSADTIHSLKFHEHAEKDCQEVPIISWAKAGEAHEFSGIPFDWQETVTVDIPKRHKALGIEIVGDSMEPRYYDGQIAVVLPESRPINGDLVIAHIKNIGIVFKKFHFNGDPANPVFNLTSYNPDYPPCKYKEADFFWIWPVARVIDNLRKFS
jgi:phage repressor protein C with HTH and peptisase S24 domain